MTPNQPYPPYPAPPQPAPQKSKTGLYIFLGLGCFLLLVVGGIIALVALGGLAAFSVGSQAISETKPVVEGFMRAGAQNDAQSGHGYFAEFAKEEVSVSKIETLFEQRALFEGYESLNNQGFNVETKNGKTVCHLNGTISYSSPPSGTYIADLVKEGSSWKLYNIKVNRGKGE